MPISAARWSHWHGGRHRWNESEIKGSMEVMLEFMRGWLLRIAPGQRFAEHIFSKPKLSRYHGVLQ